MSELPARPIRSAVTHGAHSPGAVRELWCLFSPDGEGQSMSNGKRDYDSTVARIAGNIVGHLIHKEAWQANDLAAATVAVALARAIVAEVKRTEPADAI